MNNPAVVSADSHVVEPPDLWLDYIDPKYREIAPRYVRENGIDLFWTAEMKAGPMVGALGSIGKPAAEERREGRHEEGRPGGWDPKARLPDMDTDGVDAEILYPSF